MNDETEIDPGFNGDRDNMSATEQVAADCQDTYAILDELETQLEEACEEQTEWGEEIDRQNLRRLLDDLDMVQRVRYLVMEIVDPDGPPSTDDPIPPTS